MAALGRHAHGHKESTAGGGEWSSARSAEEEKARRHKVAHAAHAEGGRASQGPDPRAHENWKAFAHPSEDVSGQNAQNWKEFSDEDEFLDDFGPDVKPLVDRA